MFVHEHAPFVGLQRSSVQTFASLQFFGAPGLHTPVEQVSASVQALPSSHGAVLLTKPHPVTGLHESVVHTLPSSQTRGEPP